MSTDARVHRHPRVLPKVLRQGPVWLATVLPLLAGCATAPPQDPTAMIPPGVQASVLAEEQMRQARESANAGDPNAKPMSVQEILARARAAEATTPAPGTGAAAGPDPATLSTAAGKAGTGTGAAGAAGAATGSIGAAGAPPPAARRPPPGREFEVAFQGADDTPGSAEAAALAKAWKAGKVPAKAQVMITAGPGPGESAFDQALLANKRLRAVRSLLPADLDAKQLYDPDMTPDTVRITVGSTD